jgi:Peptidase A4 family
MTFSVPTVTCPAKKETRVSEWAGVGGLSAKDPLFQVGVASHCTGGVPSYYLFYEIVGGPDDTKGEVVLPASVAPGNSDDQVAVGIGADSGYDAGLNGYPVSAIVSEECCGGYGHSVFEGPIGVAATPPLSGECVMDRPAKSPVKFYSLANFGKTAFYCAAFASSTVTPMYDLPSGDPTPWSLDRIQMTQDGTSHTAKLASTAPANANSGTTLTPAKVKWDQSS